MSKLNRVDPIAVAKPFREEISKMIATSYQTNPPKLVAFLASDDPFARKYAEWTGRSCLEDKINYELREVEKMDLEKALHEANRDPSVHGIMIYYPVFGQEPSFDGGSMDDYLRDSIAPEKDVEGLCHTFRSSLYRNNRFMDAGCRFKCILPCTPLACVKILEAEGAYIDSLPVGSRLRGKTVTVVNRSEVVGRPLAALLANDGAAVYSIDLDSNYLVTQGTRCMKVDLTTEEAVRLSSVVVLGVPTKSYKLNPECIQPNTLVLNVSSFKNVDPDSLEEIDGVKFCAAVGKVTVAMLERNLLRLYENFGGAHVTSNEEPLKGKQLIACGERKSSGSNAESIVFWSAITCVLCTAVSSAVALHLARTGASR